MCSTADRMSTDCVAGVCSHKKAYKWIESQQCARWYHCVCVGLTTKVVNVQFICAGCEKSM